MKVKIKQSVSTTSASYSAGKIVELADELAKQWTENGLCEIQVVSKPKRRKAK
jgi:hypothetical protein